MRGTGAEKLESLQGTVIAGRLVYLSWEFVSLRSFGLRCSNWYDELLRLTCLQLSFIPRRVKDSSLCGCTNHHRTQVEHGFRRLTRKLLLSAESSCSSISSAIAQKTAEEFSSLQTNQPLQRVMVPAAAMALLGHFV